MNNFEVTLQCLHYLNSPFYIASDINIDSLKIQSNNYVLQYHDFISSYNVYNIVTKATCLTSNTDHFCINNTKTCSNCYIINSDFTDHFPLVVKIYSKLINKCKQKLVIYVHSLKFFKEVEFCNDVEESCRQSIDFSKSINEQVKMLHYVLNNLIDQYMPLCKLSRREAKLKKNHG